ncbi:MAG: sarcosine oxidase subunit gamma [Proteobacteria bacterium]|nr:sarcosine oxidase subunit gamma [Pseudomonadota bacterium]MBS0572202.1 sarcosine oxidase subunit gamma [Pseudomonadota bacterium]
MAKLIAKPATDGLLPLTVGGLTLSDATPKRLTAVAPWPGAVPEAAAALQGIGLDWPAPDRAAKGDKGLCLWSGRDQAFLADVAPAPALADAAAVTDISDAWVALKLTGPAAAAALSRLVAIDLSPRAFPEGASARTGLGHMMALIHRSSSRSFTLYVFRSMAASAIHEIGVAMRSLAARASV